ncbi:hypothetical protein ASG52_21410 [Methylobacterium sp. Leaf456]|uniref:hypothetical protein n=1 Tax=Methylobacterium sp. Leaf456 TaxID=1736382 RepID=UPI0006F5699B|nr:hypothetical protein [Methylobacterium sp. Leaf456]KQT58690.1 hypothetical protein ASG52_21410 [Methylobacterium sp. Leaf456]
MTTGPRRILVTALLAALVGLGLVAVLFGRRPHGGAAAEIEAPPPAPSPALSPSSPSAPIRTPGRGRLALAAGLAGLLLLAGGILASRDILFEPRSSAPDGRGPPTALSPPQAGLR